MALFVSDKVIMSLPPTNCAQQTPHGIRGTSRRKRGLDAGLPKMTLFTTGGESDKRPETVKSNSQVQNFVFIELMELTQRS